MNATIRPSGDRTGAVAESVKLVSCTYSEGDVTGERGKYRYATAAATDVKAIAVMIAKRRAVRFRFADTWTSIATAVEGPRSATGAVTAVDVVPRPARF